MQSILNTFRYMPKRFIPLLALLIAVVGSGVIVFASWSPNRPTFTEDNPAPYVTFNSITDNSIYGDERPFFDVKNANNTTAGGFEDVHKVENGDTVKLRVYVHNNASSSLNESGEGIAKDAKARVLIPTGHSTNMRSIAYISASNAQPNIVSDTIDLYADNAFSLEYVPGSARLQTNGGDFTLSDSIVDTGAPLGYNSLNGEIPGCFEYVGYVTLEVKVNMADIDVQKTVREEGQDDWQETTTVDAGDTLEYRIRVENNGGTTENITVGDNLPPHMTYVNGSTKLYDANSPNGTALNDKIATGGFNIGNYAPGGVAYIVFKATVDQPQAIDACGTITLTNVAVAKSTNVTPEMDTAVAKVKTGNSCEEPTPDPIYSCDALSASPTTLNVGEKVLFTADITAENGATVSSVDFDFGNGTSFNSPTSGAEAVYETAGNYTATATVNFTVNGEAKSDSTNCSVNVTVKEETPDPIYTCDALNASKTVITAGESVAFTVDVTAENGATADSFTIAVNGNNINKGGSINGAINHIFNGAGTYTVQASVDFTVNGEAKTVTTPNCKVVITAQEEPVEPIFTCDALTATAKIDGKTIGLSATATAVNAQIQKYTFDFGDGTKQIVETANNFAQTNVHTYAAGSYTATVSVDVLVDGNVETVTSNACATQITVEEEITPVYTCDAFSASQRTITTGDSVDFTVNASATGGAQVIGYVFDFGDNNSEVVDTNELSATQSHTYTTAGNYEASVVVVVDVNGTTQYVTNQACETPVTAEDEPEEKNPIAICKSVTAERIGETLRVKVTATVSAKDGATVNNAMFTFDQDNTYTATDFVDAGDHMQTVTVEHEYATDGEKNIDVKVTFSVDGEDDRTIDCSTSLTLDTPETPEEPETPVTPVTPEEPVAKGVVSLPNTGAGSVLFAIFGISAVGTLAKSWISSKNKLVASLLG